MEMNAGCLDRFVRIFAGVVIFGLALCGTIGSWGYLGVIGIATGLSGMCPLYAIVGLSTCSCSEESH